MQPVDELMAELEEVFIDDEMTCATYVALTVTLLEDVPKNLIHLIPSPPYAPNREVLSRAFSKFLGSLKRYLKKVCDVNSEAESLYKKNKDSIQRQIEKLREDTLKKIENVKSKYSEQYHERKIEELRKRHEKSEEGLKNRLRTIEENFKKGRYHEEALIRLMNHQKAREAIEKIEEEYYHRFRSAALDCVDIEILDREERRVLVKFLRMVRRESFKKTPKGSVYITDDYRLSELLDLIRELRQLEYPRKVFLPAHNFTEKLKIAGIIHEFHVSRDLRYVILAPFLEESFLRLLESESDIMVDLLKDVPINPPEVKVDFEKCKSLVDVVSQVIRVMGFEVVEINSGNTHADVGAYRLLSGQKFRMWVRCKEGYLTANDVKGVAKFVSSSPKKPNLVLVIADFADQDVIEEADKHGMFTVTTGLKASSSNKKVLAEVILNRLSRLVGFNKN